MKLVYFLIVFISTEFTDQPAHFSVEFESEFIKLK